jgi:monofunctional biosynthetic peptidoglycan transglycosylase
MKTLILSFMLLLFNTGDSILFDFDTEETMGDWYIVNDGVMGGISESQMQIFADGIATFSGTVSPDNNGGFASIRAKVNTDSQKEYQGIVMRVKGDGNIYNLRFRTNRGFDGYAYQAKFSTKKDEWMEVSIPFSDFKPTFRGRMLSQKPPLYYSNIEQIGILVADKQWGAFSLDLDWIKWNE